MVRLLQADEPVFLLVAPSFVGQFGPTVTPGRFKQACLDLGFTGMLEVALGADQVAKEEAAELAERLQAGEKFMTSSCCPAFVDLVEKHFPKLVPHVSHTPSPMVRAAQIARERGAKRVVFAGPCIAKKAEAIKVGRDLIDAVLTFEELGALFAAKEINLAAVADTAEVADATSAGRLFAKAGGVAAAVQEALAEQPDGPAYQPCAVSGLANCKQALKLAAAGRLNGNMLEGMVCVDGCVGGPGTLVASAVATRKVVEFAKPSKQVS